MLRAVADDAQAIADIGTELHTKIATLRRTHGQPGTRPRPSAEELQRGPRPRREAALMAACTCGRHAWKFQAWNWSRRGILNDYPMAVYACAHCAKQRRTWAKYPWELDAFKRRHWVGPDAAAPRGTNRGT